jgi:hypothetical protein
MSKKNEAQAKAKLKIRVEFKDGETTINEYDLAAMVSDLNLKVIHLTQAVSGITNAMKSATLNMASGPVSTEEYLATGSIGSITPPTIPTIKLPKLES